MRSKGEKGLGKIRPGVFRRSLHKKEKGTLQKRAPGLSLYPQEASLLCGLMWSEKFLLSRQPQE
jgi:hypothetical protein